MRNNINFENARLIESLDYIDRDLIAEVIDDIKAPDMKRSPERDKTVTRRSIRYSITLVACLVLISAIIPVVSYVSTHFNLLAAGSGGDSISEAIADSAESNTETLSDTTEAITEASPENTEVTIEIPSDHIENAPYPIFTPDLEPISAEMIAELKEAWYQYVYDAEYKEISEDNPSYRDSKISSMAKSNTNSYTSYLFSENTEDHFYTRYYGTINSCIILAMNSRLEGKNNTIKAGNTIINNDYSFYLFAYRGGQFESLKDAYNLGWLNDENIKKIKERHDQFVSCGCWIVNTDYEYSYAQYTPVLEAVSNSVIEEINTLLFEAKQKKYIDTLDSLDKKYQNRKDRECAANEAYLTFKNESTAFAKNKNTPDSTFEENFRYYGTVGDCVVWAALGQSDMVNQYHIGNYLFHYLPTGASLKVFCNGQIISLGVAHKKGIISDDGLDIIYQRYRAYNEYLENPDRTPVEVKPISPALAYSAKLTVEELYADVQKGDWVITSNLEIQSKIELWNAFIEKTARGEAASILIADYYPAIGDVEAQIYLKDVSFDGKTYTIIKRTGNKVVFTETEHNYLMKYELEKEDVYVFAHLDTYSYAQIKAHSSQEAFLIKITK